MNGYPAGTLVRIANYSGTITAPVGGFRDANGNLADPTTVILAYRAGPDQPLLTVIYPAAPVIKDAVGLYHADWDTTPAVVADVWTYRWSGTGAVQAESPLGQFAVSIAGP